MQESSHPSSQEPTVKDSDEPTQTLLFSELDDSPEQASPIAKSGSKSHPEHDNLEICGKNGQRASPLKPILASEVTISEPQIPLQEESAVVIPQQRPWSASNDIRWEVKPLRILRS